MAPDRPHHPGGGDEGLTSEVVAGVAKLMTNLDLIYGASKIRITAHCNTTIGLPGTLAARLQPNHPTDDIEGITASLFEGLSYGVGDAVIGLNPVDDSMESVKKVLIRFQEVKEKFGIPTQICVLAHVTTQSESGVEGAYKYLRRLWSYAYDHRDATRTPNTTGTVADSRRRTDGSPSRCGLPGTPRTARARTGSA